MEKNKFTHGSLFSGIGGPEIAAEEMGWKNMFHCEINRSGEKYLIIGSQTAKVMKTSRKQILQSVEKSMSSPEVSLPAFFLRRTAKGSGR